MRKLAGTAILAATLSLGTAHAQNTDDITVEVTVTAEPQITITPAGDAIFTSDGVTATPPQIQPNICFETNLSDVSVTISKTNPIQNSLPSMSNAVVNDFINYNLTAQMVGVGLAQPFTSIDTRDYDITSATLGSGACSASQFRFIIVITPTTDPNFASRAISETVAANNLDDGTPYAFSDILTVTFEPTL